ncbi:MAG: helix-hairpin-helix domain-containing protein [Patescibacteria group bacterium]|nr:helix-hairpin-helix domain-containing protein [Patescibacteria group bacterium]MDD5715263.1 helix-hairpin-helix domain-containing protein [Patescibacteria group bacterium]
MNEASREFNQQIAALFFKKGKILETKGERYRFRTLSYYRAARAVEALTEGLDEIYRRSWLAGLQKINGIGNRLSHDIERELIGRGIKR